MAKKSKNGAIPPVETVTEPAVETDEPSVMEQGTALDHNMGVRGDLMRNGFKNLHNLEAQIAALEVKHIKPLKRILAKDRKKMCADLTMKWADLKHLYGLERRVLEAQEMEDEDVGNTIIDNIREAAEHLGKGEVLDFFAVLSEVEKAEQQDPDYLGDENADDAGDGFEEDAQSGPEKMADAGEPAEAPA